MKLKLCGGILAFSLLLSGCTSNTSSPVPPPVPSSQEATEEKAPLTVISLAPALTQILVDLDPNIILVGMDNNSSQETLAGTPQILDMIEPDMEILSSLQADLILTSDMSLYTNAEAFAPLEKAGTTVLVFSAAENINMIKEQIITISQAVGVETKGIAMLDELDKNLAAIAEKSKEYETQTVLFEISPLPEIYSFGQGVFLDEMLTTLGLTNVLGSESGWIGVTEEAAIASNPDVIFTNVGYTEDPVAEILSRKGWSDVTAIKNNQVFFVDPNTSAQPNHRIVDALEQMFANLHPTAEQSTQSAA